MEKFLLFVMLLSSVFNVNAQDFTVQRNAVSQDGFKTIIFDKYKSFNDAKPGTKKMPKLTKEDLIDILSSVPFSEDGKFLISYVRSVDGVNKKDLYNKINQSLIDVFVNANNVIQMQDEASGIIVGKGISSGGFSFKMMGIMQGKEDVNYTFKIQIKDNRYKIDIYDIDTEKGDLLDDGSSIEIYLNPEFYNTSFGKGALKTKRTDAHYINVRTQLLLSQLYELYGLEESVYDNIVRNNNLINEDW